MLEKNISHPKLLYGKTGVLLVNLGTPNSTKTSDVRKYLKQFLSDRRVIEVNRILWFFILNLIILTFRPKKTAKLYKKIWMKKEDMSPLRFYTIKQREKLSKFFDNRKFVINYAMRYGDPGIPEKLIELKNYGCEKIIILPLYPQYAAATTATVSDEVFKTLIKMRWQPSLQMISHYESEPLYIKALAKSLIKEIKNLSWRPNIIVASYHGIPMKYFKKGDPYHCYCHKTTRLLKEYLDINIPIITTFQSRFGPDEWLKPYTDEKFEELAKKKKKLLVICPGFSSDCVETLEEISIQGKESFIAAGGKHFAVVPCLNDNKDQILLLKKLIEDYDTSK